jgi:fructokinase
LGARLIIITRGGQGALALFGSSQIEVPALQVTVCDSVGAGDTFMGGLLASMAQDNHLGIWRNPDDAQMAHWLTFATKAASLCCTRPGADPPTRTQMMAQQ